MKEKLPRQSSAEKGRASWTSRGQRTLSLQRRQRTSSSRACVAVALHACPCPAYRPAPWSSNFIQACRGMQELQDKEAGAAAMTAAPAQTTDFRRIQDSLVQLLQQAEAHEAEVTRRAVLVGQREDLLNARERQMTVHALL